MRNRTPDSTTPLDQTKSWLYSVTEKGRRAIGATSIKEEVENIRQAMDKLEQAAGQLLQEPPKPAASKGRKRAKKPLSIRHATICGRYRQDGKTRVSDLRLSGKWLANAGFEIGQKYQVRVDKDRLTIWAKPKQESEQKPKR